MCKNRGHAEIALFSAIKISRVLNVYLKGEFYWSSILKIKVGCMWPTV